MTNIRTITVIMRGESLLPLIILLIISSSVVLVTEARASNDFAIRSVPWGGKCQIPIADQFVLPENECDQSKGIFCQQFTQGDYCGCKINSPQSYDRLSGECRRMPYQHCYFVNETLHPERYKSLPYHLKCHTNAACNQVEDSTTTGSEDVKGICKCLEGHIVSKDRRECVNVNGAHLSVTPLCALLLTLSFTISMKSLDL